MKNPTPTPETVTVEIHRIRTSTIALIALIAFILGFLLGMLALRRFRPCVELPVVTIQKDTVIIRDTVRGEIPKPRIIERTRYDTVRLQIVPDAGGVIPGDTVRPVNVKKDSAVAVIPIERKVYQTVDYRAVVSGFNPNLDSIDVYRSTTTVTNTVARLQRPRWTVSAGGGVGYSTEGRILPFAGVFIGRVLWSK